MVLLKQLFKEACDKFGYDDYYRMENKSLTTRERLNGAGGLEYIQKRKLDGDTLSDIAKDFQVKPQTIRFYLGNEYNTSWNKLLEYYIVKYGFSNQKEKKPVFALIRAFDQKVIRSSVDRAKLVELAKTLMEE